MEGSRAVGSMQSMLVLLVGAHPAVALPPLPRRLLPIFPVGMSPLPLAWRPLPLALPWRPLPLAVDSTLPELMASATAMLLLSMPADSYSVSASSGRHR